MYGGGIMLVDGASITIVYTNPALAEQWIILAIDKVVN